MLIKHLKEESRKRKKILESSGLTSDILVHLHQQLGHCGGTVFVRECVRTVAGILTAELINAGVGIIT